MERLRSDFPKLRLDRRLDVRGYLRAQVELGQGSPHVEATAADEDRPPALREGRVDLGMCAPRELPNAVFLLERHEPDEPVFEPPFVLLGRPAAQDWDPSIDLHRIAIDCDCSLPSIGKEGAELDRHTRLANPGRACEGDHQWWIARPIHPGRRALRQRSGSPGPRFP